MRTYKDHRNSIGANAKQLSVLSASMVLLVMVLVLISQRPDANDLYYESAYREDREMETIRNRLRSLECDLEALGQRGQ